MNSNYIFRSIYFHEKTLLAASKHILMWTLVALPLTGFTQTSFNASDCREIQAPDGRADVDLCNSHAGCRMVLENRKTCTNAKKFLTHLLEAIGPGTKGLFGIKREVTPEAIFQASAVDTKSVAEVNVNATENAKKIQALLATQEKRELAEKPTVLGNTVLFKGWVYYGEVADGKANGQGTKIYSDGLIQRGKFTAGVMNGLAETIFPSGTREIGFFESGYKQGQVFTAVVAEQGVVGIDGDFHLGKLQNGKITQPDGSFFEGSFNEQGKLRGRHVRANGTLIDEGSYKENQLFIGKTYDAQGKLTAEVNKPREQEIAAIAASRAEEARKLEAQTQEQKRRDSVAASEQTFRDSLSSMNAGQLFTKADELSTQADKGKARETLRLLVSKFPDHPLAATAAQQMATMSAASVNASTGNSGGNSNAAASGTGSNVAENMGDVCNGQVPAFIEQKWARFNDPGIRKMYADTAKPFAQKLREDTRSATRAQVTQEVKAVLANFRTQVSVAVDNYCKMQAGCSDPKPIERSWPAALASNMPKINGQSTSEVMASQYVIVGFAIDYFSAYEKYLACPSR